LREHKLAGAVNWQGALKQRVKKKGEAGCVCTTSLGETASIIS